MMRSREYWNTLVPQPEKIYKFSFNFSRVPCWAVQGSVKNNTNDGMGALGSAVCAVFPQSHLVQVQGWKRRLFQLLCCQTNHPEAWWHKNSRCIVLTYFMSQESGQNAYSFSPGPQRGDSGTGVTRIISWVWCHHSRVWKLILAGSWNVTRTWPGECVSYGCSS